MSELQCTECRMIVANGEYHPYAAETAAAKSEQRQIMSRISQAGFWKRIKYAITGDIKIIIGN